MRSRSWRWRLAANTLVALVGATVRQTVDYARGRASRSAIRSHRNNGASNPPLWVALVPDWLRLSRQVLDAIALPTIESGGELGVFISSNLRRGMRSEDRGRHIGNDLWPGLGTLRKFLDRCPVEQLVSPESFRSFAGHLLTSAVASARVAQRLSRTPLINDAPFCFDLRRQSWPLAKLITVDVAHARAAALATEQTLARRSMIGTTVVFAGSASASVAGADVTLQRAGVRTVELWHGAGSDVLFGNPESNSQFRCVWTLPDAQVFRELGRPCIVGGMPVRAPMPRLRTRGV